MDLTRAAIEKDRVTVVILLFLIVAGLAAYQGLPRTEDPEVTFRRAVVLTRLPGASPERVEHLVTDPIEAALQEIPEIDFVTSRSRTGVSLIRVEVRDDVRDMRPIWDNLRRKVARVAPDLPADVIGPLVNDELGDIFEIIVTLTGDGYSYAELKELADAARDALLRIDDVAKVDIYGAPDERIFVNYENERLAELGVAPLQLRSILESVNIVIPGGDVRAGAERIALEPTGAFESIDDLRRTVVTLPGRSEIVALEDLAAISRGYVEPPVQRVYASGTPALALAISMREGGNVVALGAGVRREIARLQARYPIGVEFDVARFQPEVVDARIRTFIGSLFQSVGVVVGVVLLFMGLRTGFVVASPVAVTIIAALFLMSVFGIGLDQVSLAALILALGMLVDNAIVMTEAITMQMKVGRQPIEAAVNSARELRRPLLVASLTTAAAFLPIFLAESSTGEYTAPLFKVVTITLLSSWILALTVTPLLCVRFLRSRLTPDREQAGPGALDESLFVALERAELTSAGEAYDGRFHRIYRVLLLAGLRHRAVALTALAVVFLIAMQGFRLVPRIFFPPSDQAIFTAEYDLPAGTSVERTTAVAEAIDRFVASELRAGGDRPPAGADVVLAADAGTAAGRAEGVTNWVTFVGNGGPRFHVGQAQESSSAEYAFAILNATSGTAITDDLIPRLQAFCRERFPDLRVTLRTLQIGPPFAAPVEVRLSGRDQEAVLGAVASVKARLRATPGARNVEDDWGPRSKKLVIEVDQPRALRAGVTNRDVAMSLQTALSGFEMTRYREAGTSIPVLLRSTIAGNADPTMLDNLTVHAQATGRAVPLLQVADPELIWEPSTVRRRNRIRTVTVSSDVDPGVTPGEVVAQLRPWLDAEQAGWPLGLHYEFGGEEERSVEANRSIVEKLPIAGLVITLLLVGQFNSIRRAVIILLTIPLGLIGVVAGLIIAQSYFGFMTLLGVVGLAGIVINNAIVIVDRIGVEIDEYGLDPQRAIVGAAQRRLRPILLTTVTTVVGLIPLWIGGGPIWEPMAVSIIFGLLFATVLTLGLVPILYSVFFGVRFDRFEY